MTDSSSQPACSAGSPLAAEPENPQPAAQKNAAVERCIQAWQRRHELMSIRVNESEDFDPDQEDEGENFAYEQAGFGFRETMPVLDSYENIRDFIACTAYSMAMKYFEHEEGQDLLKAAGLAMAHLKGQRKAAEPPINPRGPVS